MWAWEYLQLKEPPRCACCEKIWHYKNVFQAGNLSDAGWKKKFLFRVRHLQKRLNLWEHVRSIPSLKLIRLLQWKNREVSEKLHVNHHLQSSTISLCCKVFHWVPYFRRWGGNESLFFHIYLNQGFVAKNFLGRTRLRDRNLLFSNTKPAASTETWYKSIWAAGPVVHFILGTVPEPRSFFYLKTWSKTNALLRISSWRQNVRQEWKIFSFHVQNFETLAR